MRPYTAWLLAGCGGAALAGPAAAQQPPQTVNVTATPFQMPGTPVGTPLVQPVGAAIPKAAPSVGSPVGTGPGGIPGALNPGGGAPPGRVIDTSNVVAPYPGMPSPPPSFWDKLQQRWFALLGSNQPAQKPTQWTPGIARRNRERAREREEMRQRD